MKKSNSVNANKRGRPVTTGTGTVIGVRMLDQPLAMIDQWIELQGEADLSRPEAIRRLVEIGLQASSPAKKSSASQRARAAELAEGVIDKVLDNSKPDASERKRRILEGPSTVREDRVDRPKKK